MFEAVDLHQVVRGELYPERSDMALAPRPETLPTPLIHLVRLKERETLYPRQNREFLGSRINDWFQSFGFTGYRCRLQVTVGSTGQ